VATPVHPSRIIISDGVFSVKGHIAPAGQLAKLAYESAPALVLDESHAAGVIGEQSSGTAEACGLDPRRDVTAFTGTVSKAFGAGGGGYIAGSIALMNEVKRAAVLHFQYGHAVATAGAAIVGVEKASTDSERRDRLRAKYRASSQIINEDRLQSAGT
jgi:glycine C-acetyltransferase